MSLYDVPGVADDPEIAALIGSTEEQMIDTATIAGRVKAFIRNLILNAVTLIPTLASGRPNPGSQSPQCVAMNLRGSSGAPWDTTGQFIFSSETGKGYELAYVDALSVSHDNWRARVDQSGVVDVDIRDNADTLSPATIIDSGNTAIFQDPYLVAGRLTTLMADEGLDIAVAYSGWRVSVDNPGPNGETTPTYRFTVYSPGNTNFDMDVTGDASSLWGTLGFTSDRTGGDNYEGDVRAIHSEECIVMDLGSLVLAFDRQNNARIERWRHWISTISFEPADAADPFPRMTFDLRLEDNFAGVATIDFTGQEFDTKAELAAWLQAEIRRTSLFGNPYTVTVGGSGELVIHSVDPNGADVIVTGQSNSVGPLIGFTADTMDVLGFTTGDPFDLDALNGWLRSLRPGGDKIVLYLGNNAAALDQAPDSDFGDGVTMFSLRIDSMLGVAWGTDAGGWPRPGTPELGHELFPSGFLWVDLLKWIGTATNRSCVRVKVVNRQNPLGFLSFAPMFFGPGTQAIWNVTADSPITVVDRSTLDKTPAGAFFSRTLTSGKRIGMTCSPLTKEEAHILEACFLDARRSDKKGRLELDTTMAASKIRNVWVHDPANRSQLLDSCAKAYGMVRGRIVDYSMEPDGRLGQGYFRCSLTIEGDR